MNGRPLSNRKKAQLLVLLTLLAWATQTLVHQWGFGAVVTPGDDDAPAAALPAAPVEKFMRAPAGPGAGTLELRGEATVYGGEVRLRQICRWADADAAVFLPVADLVVLRFDGQTPFKSISLDELKTALGAAKANLAMIRLSGPLLCTVRRSDTPADPKSAFDQWIDAREGGSAAAAEKEPSPRLALTPTDLPAVLASARQGPAPAASRAPAAPTAPAAPADGSPVRTLRQLLAEDLGVRLDLPVDQLHISFNPKDDRVLNLAEPQFQFNLEAVRARNLGTVEWNVLIVRDNDTKKVPIEATARAWLSEVVVTRALSARQIIRAEDVTERRRLADRLNDEPLLSLAQVVGQQAGRDLTPGTAVTARLVEAVPLVKQGQTVWIHVNQGGIQLTSSGRAMEAGAYGQTIRVQNEATNQTYAVIITGPQEGCVGVPPPAATPLAAAQ